MHGTAEPKARMRPVEGLIAFGEARRLTLAAFEPVSGAEHLALAKAQGRVLAGDVTAPRDVPAEARASMDGYAVRASDVSQASATLVVTGVLHAGDSPDGLRVRSGTCVQVATGAMLPPGADSVVMVERTRRQGERVEIEGPVELGQFVAARGSDVPVGSVVLKEGQVLDPFRLAVAAAVGVDHVVVRRRPRIRLQASGSEVVPLGSALTPGQVFDSNTVGLEPILSAAGADVAVRPPLEDTPEAWSAALGDLADVDAVVMTGGSSAGERDLAAPTLSRMGRIVFHGVRVKPGKPMLLAVVAGKPVVVLPGFPASCLLDAVALVAPAVRRMAGIADPVAVRFSASMAHAVRSPADKHHLLPVRLAGEGAVESTFRDSGATTSLAGAVGYVEIPEGVDRLEVGERVQVVPF